MSQARHVANDYAGFLDALRAVKAELGLSNEMVEDLCNWSHGMADKYLGPTESRGLAPKALASLIWVLALRIEVSIDPERLREMEQEYERRHGARIKQRQSEFINRTPRVSQVILARARPVIFAEAGRKGGHRRAACLPAKHRKEIAATAAQTRWQRHRREVKAKADAAKAKTEPNCAAG